MRKEMRQLRVLALGIFAGVMISINVPAFAQPGSAVTLPNEELRALTEVYGHIKNGPVDSVDDKKLIAQAIAGMLAGLDPHSSYLDKEAFREIQVGTTGEFGGLGMEVSLDGGYMKVVSPIDDSPASRAGVKPGDLIVKLGDIFVKGMTLNDAVKQMRGKPNTSITLTITRAGEDKPLVFTLKRAIVKIQSVKSKLLEPGYAYFRVTQFQGPTGEALANAIQAVFRQNQGPMKGLVLDLRNDPGGLLTGAVAVSAAFLPTNALVVYTEGRTEDAKQRLTANRENYLARGAHDYLSTLPPAIKDVPMVVLVNGGSASASEIVAGALQDHRRAIIMGAQTFGKASVQMILPLRDGTAIKLTTARYYTPNGRSIQVKGIVPDIALDDGSSSETNLRVREADLSKHLINDLDPNQAPVVAVAAGSIFNFTPAARPQGVDEKDLKPELGEVVAKSDYELAQAIAFLKSRGTAHASVN